MCDQVSQNVDVIHEQMSVLNSEHIERIISEIETMQDQKVVADSNEDDKKGSSGIILRVKEFIKERNTIGERQYHFEQLLQGEFIKRIEMYLEGKAEAKEGGIQEIAVNAIIVMAICNKEQAYNKYLQMHLKRQTKIVLEEQNSNFLFSDLLEKVYKFLFQLINLRLSSQKQSSLKQIVGVIQDFLQLLKLLQIRNVTNGN